METGKQRINMAVLGHEAKAEEEPELALAIAQAVERELEHDPVAAEREHAKVVVAQERGPVEVALGLVQVGVELELSRVEELEPVPAVEALVLVQVAVAPRTKWVTAAHRHGQVPVLRAEDLAAAVETTREPVAAGAAIAWAAADIAVVVAAPA